MKKINQLIITGVVLALAIMSCKKEEEKKQDVAPTADFSVSKEYAGVNKPVYFTNSTQNTATGYMWDFGDGNTSAEKSPTHRYMEKGTYTVSLVAMNGSSSDKMIITNAIEVGYVPGTNFDIDAAVPYCTGKQIKFVNKTTSETEVLNYNWNLKSGYSSGDESPVYTYEKEGIYNIRLTVTNKYGDSTLTKQIDVKGLTIADFYCITDVAVGEVISFRDTSSYSPTSWTWEFGDLQSTNDQHPTHSYNIAGEYTVKLTTENEYGMSDPKEVIINVGSVKDIDGNKYRTTKVGTQVWMAENLRVTHFPDGTEIPYVESATDWSALGTEDPGFCYPNGDISNLPTYGALYNFSAATNNGGYYDDDGIANIQGMCPDGWHLASLEDWNNLEDFIASKGYPDIDNYWHTGEWLEAIKSEDYWSEEQKGTDEYGLSILPTGNRGSTYYLFDSSAYYWTGQKSSYQYDRAQVVNIDDDGQNNALFPGGSMLKFLGLSIRCVRDEPAIE